MSTNHSHPHGRPPAQRCAICGERAVSPVRFHVVRPSIAELIAADHPGIVPDDLICRRHLTQYRTRHIENLLARERGELSDLEREVVASLAREEIVSRNTEGAFDDRRTLGERLADGLASFGGSWRFIISFLAILLGWIVLNIWVLAGAAFDPYPFILLNLFLSCLAALQAPVIMMSQGRQEAKDRVRSENDFRVNLKAELEIRHLHEKVDHLLNRQWERLVEIQQVQMEIMQDLAARPR